LEFYNDAKSHSVLESLHFILEVEEFVSIPVDYSMEREKDIINTYLMEGSIYEVNLPSSERIAIQSKRGTKDSKIFISAQRIITHLLIRNVDTTWKYKQSVPPAKPLKVWDIRKEIEKVTPDERIQDLIHYFLVRRITPLMYHIRNPVESLHYKIRTAAPIGCALIMIKEFTEYTLTNSGMHVYINGKSVYRASKDFITERNTKVRTTSKFGQNSFKWDEKLKFEVKDIETQCIDMHIWEKKITPNSLIGSFMINLKELIVEPHQISSSQLTIDINNGSGQVFVDIEYQPDEKEVRRLKKVEEDKEKATRITVSPEYNFLT